MKTLSVTIAYKEQLANNKAASVKGSWTTQLILLNYVDYCLDKNSVISTIRNVCIDLPVYILVNFHTFWAYLVAILERY